MKADDIDLEIDPASGVMVATYGDDLGPPGVQERAIWVDTLEFERLPSGRLVKKLRSVHKTEWVADRMLRLGSITPDMHAAALRFNEAFEQLYRSQISGITAFHRLPSGNNDTIPERVLRARERVRAAVDMLGGTASLPASACWFVLGWGESIADWSRRRSIHEKVGSGVLVAALAVLASNDAW